MVNRWNKSLFLLYCLPEGCSWHGFADPSFKSACPGSIPHWYIQIPWDPIPVIWHWCSLGPHAHCVQLNRFHPCQREGLPNGSGRAWDRPFGGAVNGSLAAGGSRHQHGPEAHDGQMGPVLTQPARAPSGAALRSIPLNRAFDDSYRIPCLPHCTTSSLGPWEWDPCQSQCVGLLRSCRAEGPRGVPKVHG